MPWLWAPGLASRVRMRCRKPICERRTRVPHICVPSWRRCVRASALIYCIFLPTPTPPRRRERFVELLQAAPRRGGGRLVLEEAREVRAAVGPGDAPAAVQLLAFRSSLGADTVGVKRLRGPA